MKKKNPKSPAAEKWALLEKALDAAAEHRALTASREEIDADLRAAGLDPEKIGNQGAALAARIFDEQDRAEKKRAAAESHAVEAARGKYVGWSRGDLLAELTALKTMGRLGAQPTFMFRNRPVEEASDDELRSMLEDLDILAATDPKKTK